MPTAQSIELLGRRGRIVIHRWWSTEPRFVALVAHGYGEHAGRYAHVAERLVAERAAVYTLLDAFEETVECHSAEKALSWKASRGWRSTSARR